MSITTEILRRFKSIPIVSKQKRAVSDAVLILVAEHAQREKAWADANKHAQALEYRLKNVFEENGPTRWQVDFANEKARRAGVEYHLSNMARAEVLSDGLTDAEKAEYAPLCVQTRRCGFCKMQKEPLFDEANARAMAAADEFNRVAQARDYEVQVEIYTDAAWEEEFDRELKFLDPGEKWTLADTNETIRFAAERLKKALAYRREVRTELNRAVREFEEANKAQKAFLDRVLVAAEKEGLALRKHTAN